MSRINRRSSKKQLNPQPIRNWLIVDARTRHTAGQMGDKRKAESFNECRKWKYNKSYNQE